MTVELAIERFRNIIQEATTSHLAISLLRAAESSRALIFDRVTERGIDAEGKSFDGYSTKPLLTNCSAFVKQSACESVMKQKGLQWVTLNRVVKYGKNAGKRAKAFILEGGYKELRELNGRQTAHVDFSYTGDMWKSIHVMTGMSEAKEGYAVISSNNPADMAKLAGNTERKGDILALSESEIAIIAEDFEQDLLDLFRQNDML